MKIIPSLSIATDLPRRRGGRRRVWLVAGWLFLVSAITAPTQTYTLDDCLRIGLERSIPLANTRRDLDIAQHNVTIVRAQALPSLDLNASYTRLDDVPSFPDIPEPIGSRNTYAANASAEQLLYSGGAVRAALRIATNYIEAATLEVQRMESDIARRITRGFYEVLYREQEVDVAEASVRQLESFEEQARQKHRAETISEFEWLSAQVALANERPKLIAARNALEIARRAFRDLIYLDEADYSLSGSLDIEPATLDLEILQDYARMNRQEIRQAEANIAVARDQVRVARSDYFPEIRAFATYGGADPSQRNFFEEGWQWEWTAGVRLTWSLFDGFKRRAEVAAQRIHVTQEEDRLHDLTRAIALEIETVWRALGEARETLVGTADNVVLAERALEIATVRFEQGLATHLDYTDSNLALNQARLNHSRAQLAYQQALADLRYATALREWPAIQNEQAQSNPPRPSASAKATADKLGTPPEEGTFYDLPSLEGRPRASRVGVGPKNNKDIQP